MWREHEEALNGGTSGSRLVQARFRNFNANRYLQTGNAVSPVLSAAIGAAHPPDACTALGIPRFPHLRPPAHPAHAFQP